MPTGHLLAEYVSLWHTFRCEFGRPGCPIALDTVLFIDYSIDYLFAGGTFAHPAFPEAP